MRIRWLQSIRWRLALGSAAVVLLATVFMAIAAILSIAHFYADEQANNLKALANKTATDISRSYTLTTNSSTKNRFSTAVSNAFTGLFQKRQATTGLIQNAQGDGYLFLVLSFNKRHGVYVIYPSIAQVDGRVTRFWNMLNAELKHNAPSKNARGIAKLSVAVRNAFIKGTSTSVEIDQSFLGLIPHPYAVNPIALGPPGSNSPTDVLIMLPVSAANNTSPQFVLDAGAVVLRASMAIVLLAALAAVLFARTITRPLAKVTSATRVLASGDYSARVVTETPGEVGELARNFNDMAAELQRDVEELRKQELWRRELIMSITHDLATPLTAIAGLGEALVDGVNQSREEYEETGRVIVKETLRLRRLVKDLHMMAKVEAGALQPQRKPVRLAPLVDEVLAVLVTEFERGRVEPCNVISYNLPTVEADADMLTRVISNLCDNALQHTPPGGTITIDATPQNNVLAISVTDTGAGIPPEALERVFERFFRADSARQSSTGGSGLGLAIVRAIVEAHGGRIWAENVPGSGARFIFTLPLTAQAPSVPEETTLRLPHKGWRTASP